MLRKRWIFRALLAAGVATAPGAAGAQPLGEHSVEVNGETLHFSMRVFAADAKPGAGSPAAQRSGALVTATLLNRHLAAGRIEDAALLSTAPRRRFEILRDYRDAVGENEFKRAYNEYFLTENRLVAEVVMGGHSLLVWHLKSADRYAGQYYVQIEGKVLMDDTPSPARVRLSRVLEAIRAGKLSIPPG